LAQPLTGPRLTLAGRAEASDEPRARRRFLARHPGAALYADFADFRLYRVAVERGHLVAGFGRIHWLAADRLLLPEEDWRALAAAEPALLDRLNAEHAAAIAALGCKLAGEAGPWRLTGVDPEGCDLRFRGRMARFSFPERVSDPEAVARVIAEGATGAAIGEAGGSGPATGG
jgi:putative heme iron utilization protein